MIAWYEFVDLLSEPLPSQKKQLLVVICESASVIMLGYVEGQWYMELTGLLGRVVIRTRVQSVDHGL